MARPSGPIHPRSVIGRGPSIGCSRAQIKRTDYSDWPFEEQTNCRRAVLAASSSSRCAQKTRKASALSGLGGVVIVPDPSHTPMVHIHLRTTPAAVNDGIRLLATNERPWAFCGSVASGTPGFQRAELYAGDATLAITPDEVAAAVRALVPT